MSGQMASLRTFLNQRGPTDAASDASRVIVVAGGKGGVGTSTVASLLAVGLARRGERVLLVDGSQGWLHMLFGLDDVRGLAAVRAGTAAPADLVVQIRDGLDLLPAGPGDEALLLDAGPMERRALARKLGALYPRYDVVLIDAGSRLASVIEACALGADRLVAVTTAERLSVASAYALLKALRGRYPDLRRQLVVSREDPDRARPVVACLEDAAARFDTGAIEHLGTVPVDARLVVGLEGTRPIQHTAPEAPAARAAMEMAASIQHELHTRAAATGGDRVVSST